MKRPISYLPDSRLAPIPARVSIPDAYRLITARCRHPPTMEIELDMVYNVRMFRRGEVLDFER